MIKAVVFDFNGVFAQAPEKRVLQKLCALKGTGEWIALSNYYLFLWKFEQGRLAPFDFWKKVFVGLSREEFEGVVEAEYERPCQKNLEVFSLAERFSKKFNVYCLSNSNFLQGKAYRRQKLYSCFKKFFLSYETGFMKPFPSAFSHFLNEIGLKASECVFVDDSEINVLMAMALGFKGIHFTSAQELAEKLEKLGLI